MVFFVIFLRNKLSSLPILKVVTFSGPEPLGHPREPAPLPDPGRPLRMPRRWRPLATGLALRGSHRHEHTRIRGERIFRTTGWREEPGVFSPGVGGAPAPLARSLRHRVGGQDGRHRSQEPGQEGLQHPARVSGGVGEKDGKGRLEATNNEHTT